MFNYDVEIVASVANILRASSLLFRFKLEMADVKLVARQFEAKLLALILMRHTPKNSPLGEEA